MNVALDAVAKIDVQTYLSRREQFIVNNLSYWESEVERIERELESVRAALAAYVNRSGSTENPS